MIDKQPCGCYISPHGGKMTEFSDQICTWAFFGFLACVIVHVFAEKAGSTILMGGALGIYALVRGVHHTSFDPMVWAPAATAAICLIAASLKTKFPDKKDRKPAEAEKQP
jgi:hypothetical protein